MLEFLKAYQSWVFAGSPEHQIFSRDFGLCRNFVRYCRAYVHPQDNHQIYLDLTNRMKRDFPKTWRYPFGGQHLYFTEKNDGTCHLNRDRMKWVDETITKLTLLEFLGDWQSWALMSPDDDKQFNPSMGLCDQVPTLAKPLLKYLLRRDFRTSLTPFDHGEVHFSEESKECAMRLNPRRLEWVAKIIEELK